MRPLVRNTGPRGIRGVWWDRHSWGIHRDRLDHAFTQR
jgi:hypothetical protein